MAAMAVSAELRLRDGQREKICVRVENNLSSLIGGVRELNGSVTRLLSELVTREKTHGDCADDEEDEEEDEEDDDEGDSKRQNPELQPPSKRFKP